MVHTFNASPPGARNRDFYEFQASLVHKVSLGQPGLLDQRNSVLEISVSYSSYIPGTKSHLWPVAMAIDDVDTDCPSSLQALLDSTYPDTASGFGSLIVV